MTPFLRRLRLSLRSSIVDHWPLIVVLATYLVLVVAYSLASPIYEPPDELRHFRYVRHLVVYRDLPELQPRAPRAQSHHPPLYYALGALFSWWVPVEQDVYYSPPTNPQWDDRHWEVSDDNKNQYLHGDDERFPFYGVALAVYAVRWMTALIGAGAVWVTYCIGREIFPGRPALAAGSAALVAFNPQFLYLSGAVNNDIAAALCGAAVLWACVRLVRDGPSLRADVTLGVLYGLALLTKFNLLALLLLVELACVLASWRARNWRAFLRANVVILGLAALISGWWFWRNAVLYGDPTGMSRVNELWEGRPAAGNWWALEQGLPHLWSSLWGRFGYGQLPLPQAVYQGVFYFCALALAGHLVPGRRVASRAVMVLLATSVLIFVAVVFYYIMIQPAGPMGRFLFPGLPAFALLISLGLSRFSPFSADSGRGRLLAWAMGSAVAVGMAALAIYALVGVLAPAFARPRSLTEAEIEAVPNPADVEFGGVVRLLGYQVAPTEVEPGGTVEVTLYWQPLARTEQNHVVFVHLLSDVGTMVAQRDTYPGLGRNPTTFWEPGVAFADTYRVHVPEVAYAPDTGYIQVGVYLPDGPRLVTPDGHDALRLAAVEVLSPDGEFPNPVDVNFDDRVVLAGYTLDRRVARPGETIRLTLYWRSLTTFERNYSVFVHVLGDEEQIWAGSDGWPVQGNAPTRTWRPGQIIEDVHELTVRSMTPPDFYDLEVGMYASGEGRLPVIAEDGRHLGGRVLLSRVRVVSDE